MSDFENITAIREYLSLKDLLNERCRQIITEVEVLDKGISVFKSEIEIYITENSYNQFEFSFMEIEYTKLHEMLNYHLSVNSHYQNFNFNGSDLVVTDTNQSEVQIFIR